MSSNLGDRRHAVKGAQRGDGSAMPPYTRVSTAIRPADEGDAMDARWLSLTVLTIARVSLGFQFQSLASIAPPLRQALGLSYADIGFLIGLYMSPGILLAMPGGALGRRFGDKRMVCLGLALMAVGGALTWFAESSASIVL